MYKATEKTALRYIKNKRLPAILRDAGFSIVMAEKDAKAWLRALRSGGFSQTDSQLHANGSFCCLGVQQYCKLGGYVETSSCRDEFLSLPSFEYLKENGMGFFNSKGEQTSNPYIMSKNRTVAELNDDTKQRLTRSGKKKWYHVHNFEQMADLLEKVMIVY